MPDWLTHVLVASIIAMVLAERWDWIDPPHVTLVMVGALSPDLGKVGLVLDDAVIEATLGVPFAWRPLHTVGGNLIVLTILALIVAPQYRNRAFLLLVIGAASHLILDLMLLTASGYAYPVLWPLTEYQPPAGILFRSSDRWPVVVAAITAGAVWYATTSQARPDRD